MKRCLVLFTSNHIDAALCIGKSNIGVKMSEKESYYKSVISVGAIMQELMTVRPAAIMSHEQCAVLFKARSPMQVVLHCGLACEQPSHSKLCLT